MGVIEWLEMILFGLWGWIITLIGAGVEGYRNMSEKEHREYLDRLKKEVVDNNDEIMKDIYKRVFEDPAFCDQIFSEYLEVLSEIPMDTTWLKENSLSCEYSCAIYMAQHYGKVPSGSWWEPIGVSSVLNTPGCDDYKLYKKLDQIISSYHPSAYIVRVPKFNKNDEYDFEWNFNNYMRDYDRVKDLSYMQIEESIK